VDELIIEDAGSLEQIAHLVGISKGYVHSTIYNILHMNKVSMKWVPRILTPNMRQSRKDCSIELLHLIDSNPQEIFRRIMTGDGT
jgi:hypothetical protein